MINTSVNRVLYKGDGTNTAFPISFPLTTHQGRFISLAIPLEKTSRKPSDRQSFSMVSVF